MVDTNKAAIQGAGIECFIEHRKEKSISHSVARTKMVRSALTEQAKLVEIWDFSF